MAVMDEFKKEREALKNGTPREKLAYFWDYYKWHTIGAVVALVVLAAFLTDTLGQKEEVLNAAFLNSAQLVLSDEFANQFLVYADLDPSSCTATLDTTMSVQFDYLDDVSIDSTQKLWGSMAAGQLDMIAAGDELFPHYAMEGVFADLRNVLSEEQLAALGPRLYYVDRPLVEQATAASRELNYKFDPNIPDPTRPDQMEDPVPVGVYVDGSALLEANYRFSEGNRTVIGILPDSSHKETAVKFISFLLETP